MNLYRPLCLVLLSSLLAASVNAGNKLKAGDLPPDTLGKSATGERIHLGDYRGKVVVISFWASWCPPCRKELPVMINLQKAATREHLVVLSVNWQEPAAEFRALQKTLKQVDLTLISDEHGYVGEAYGVTAIPHMVIIGKDGKIAFVHIGYGDSQIPRLVDEINGLLAKETPNG